MKVQVIGNSGSYPGPDSAASCYLVSAEHQGEEYRILLDLGSGALGSLQRYSDASDIKAILLSHLHADHCLDICGYYVMRKYHPRGAMRKIPVWGPEGTSRRLAFAYDLEEDPGMNEEFDFLVYPEETFELGPFTITAQRVNHPVTAYALRIEAAGEVLCYSGDTAACEALEVSAADADLFLVEASFMETDANPPNIHLTGAEAAKAAMRAGAKSVLLTHIPPWHDAASVLAEAKGAWDGPIDLATVGRVYEVSSVTT